MGLFILVKRKGRKNWEAFIPVKKGVARSKVVQKIRTDISKGFTSRVVDGASLKRFIKSTALKKATVRKKRRVRRKKKR